MAAIDGHRPLADTPGRTIAAQGQMGTPHAVSEVPSPANPFAAKFCLECRSALARRMGAKAWELRATISLARLLAQRRHRDEARTMLADIYNRFTEGFDTVDLREAKALLEELG